MQDAVAAVAPRPGRGDQSAYNLVQAVDRSISILEALADAPKGRTIGELCDLLDMNKATVYRILSTLVFRGYAEEDLRTAVYRLNLKMFDLVKKVLRNRSLLDEARPMLDDLRERTQESVNLILINHDEMVVAQSAENLHDLMLRHQERRQSPVFNSAARKLLLASLPEHARQRALRDKGAHGLASEETVCGKEMQSLLDVIQLQGFVIDDDVTGEGTRCVAVPIHNYLSEVVAVISISVPSERADMDRVLALARDAKGVAESLSLRLGYELPPGT